MALMEDDFPSAFYHVAEAAKFALALANQCTGRLRDAYMSNANELMDLAEKCKGKCAKRSGGEKMSVEGDESKKLNDCRVERPSVRMADVAGMENVKRQIRLRMIEPLQHAEEARKHGLKVGGGILLYGPPGTGKTYPILETEVPVMAATMITVG